MCYWRALSIGTTLVRLLPKSKQRQEGSLCPSHAREKDRVYEATRDGGTSSLSSSGNG